MIREWTARREMALTTRGTYDLTSRTLFLWKEGEVVVVDSELADQEQGSAKQLLALCTTSMQKKYSICVCIMFMATWTRTVRYLT